MGFLCTIINLFVIFLLLISNNIEKELFLIRIILYSFLSFIIGMILQYIFLGQPKNTY